MHTATTTPFMPEPHFFFDTISLSNFAVAGRLDLLVDRYGAKVQVTQEVLGEVTDGVVAGYPQLRGIEAAVACGDFSASGPLSPIGRDGYRDLVTEAMLPIRLKVFCQTGRSLARTD